MTKQVKVLFFDAKLLRWRPALFDCSSGRVVYLDLYQLDLFDAKGV